MKKPMKEMAVHTWLRAQMKKRYGKQQIYIKSPPGIYSSRRGISDFVWCVKGMFIAIEVKSPIGKITLIQQNFLDEVDAAGGLGLCCVGKDESIFQKIDDWIANPIRPEN